MAQSCRQDTAKRANEMERGREVTKTLSDHSTLTSTEVGA